MRSLRKVIKGQCADDSVLTYRLSDDFEEKPEPEPVKLVSPAETSKILEDAAVQAAELMEHARKEAKRLEEEAQARGWDAGFEEGYHSGNYKAEEEYRIKMEEEISRFLAEAEIVMTDVAAKKELILQQYLDELKKVTMVIAEKIIQTGLKSSGEVVKRMILAATEKLKKVRWAKIYVSKTNSTLMLQADEAFLKELSHLSDHIKIITMESEEAGSCIIELPDAIIDASVNTQLENIKDILNDARI